MASASKRSIFSKGPNAVLLKQPSAEPQSPGKAPLKKQRSLSLLRMGSFSSKGSYKQKGILDEVNVAVEEAAVLVDKANEEARDHDRARPSPFPTRRLAAPHTPWVC